MRKITEEDLANTAGITLKGYKVEGVRIKRGEFSDSDNYGIILGRSPEGCYVTWQFHYEENEDISIYWGHYFMEDRETALRDFNSRDLSDAMKLKSDIRSLDNDTKNIEKISVQLTNSIYDRLHTLAAEFTISIELLINIAIKRLMDDVDFMRNLRVGKIEKIELE